MWTHVLSLVLAAAPATAPVTQPVADATADVTNLQDVLDVERRSQAEYLSIWMQHRPIHPFGWIIRQEREHEQAIVDALRARGAAPAADRSAAAPVAVPDTVDDARKRGVSLEKQTVAAYDAALAAIDDSALRGLLTRLRDESKMHLAAFESGQPVGRALGGMGIQGRGREPGRGQGGLGPRRGGGRTRATVPAAAPEVSAGPASCRMVVGLAPGGPCWTFAR